MTTEAPTKIYELYVQRVKARLARPSISVTDARDGILDCFVSTYHEGLTAGLRGIVGVDANPDEVARVAAGMFRKRLKAHGASFEAPTIAAIAAVKDEVDAELHITELPVELRSMHDRVCTLMLSKAEGALEHHGDRSVLEQRDAAPAPPAIVAPPARTASGTTSTLAFAPPQAHPPSSGSRTVLSLRAALSTYLAEVIERIDRGDSIDELELAYDRGAVLLKTIRQFG